MNVSNTQPNIEKILTEATEDGLFIIFSAALMALRCPEPVPGSMVFQILDTEGARLYAAETSVLSLYYRIRNDPPQLLDFLLALTKDEMRRRGMAPPVPHNVDMAPDGRHVTH